MWVLLQALQTGISAEEAISSSLKAPQSAHRYS
jgi:hypothetical protein